MGLLVLLIRSVTLLTEFSLFVLQGGSPSSDYPFALATQNCVVLDLHETVESSNPNLIYSWDYGDGTTGVGVISEHCYETVGTYQAILHVVEPHTGSEFRDEYLVEVEIKPSVELFMKKNIEINGNVKFIAELVSDDQLDVKGFYWDIDGVYYTGETLELEQLEKGSNVRLLAKFIYHENLVTLSRGMTN